MGVVESVVGGVMERVVGNVGGRIIIRISIIRMIISYRDMMEVCMRMEVKGLGRGW